MNAQLKSSAKLPAIVAVFKRHDSGEFGNASCPHCGADGRYVYAFLCEDGTTRGAMAGCIQLFPQANKRMARICQQAFERQQSARINGKKLAGWWQDVITECDRFAKECGELGFDRDRLTAFYVNIAGIEARRQAWLSKNGYGRRR